MDIDKLIEKNDKKTCDGFEGDRQERLKGYIDSQIGIVRKELYQLIGEDKDGND